MRDDILQAFRDHFKEEPEKKPKEVFKAYPLVEGDKPPKNIQEAVSMAMAKEFQQSCRDAACCAMIHGRVHWFTAKGDSNRLGVFRSSDDGDGKALAVFQIGNFADGEWAVVPLFLARGFIKKKGHEKDFGEALESAIAFVGWTPDEDPIPE